MAKNPEGARRASIGPRRNPDSAAAILDAAAAILAERGYAGFTIEAVARRAGAGKPTVYRWWPSRTALLLDVYNRQKLELADPDTGSLEGDVAALIGALWRFWRETPAGPIFRSIIAEAQSDADACQALVGYVEERGRHIAGFVERARGRGELAPHVVTATLVDMVIGYLWGRLLIGRIDDDPDEITRAAQHLVRGALSPR